jgi:cysteine synthase A
VGEYLKSKNPNIRIVAVEPEDSPVLSKGFPGHHQIQGLGAGSVPKTLNTKIYDEVITVSNSEAFSKGREVARRVENADKRIAVILPDTGERYLSTPLFAEN